MRTLLSGVRVVEVATLLNGDSVGMYLGDLGADVVKVEAPPLGDYLRDFLGQVTPRNSLPHLQVNKNKRSVALDLKSEAGREAMERLLATAEVLVDGNRHGAMTRLGFGPDQLRERFPRLVYVQHTGFGAGPYERVPTHGMLMGALAGAHAFDPGDDGFMHRRAAPSATSAGGEATSVGAVQAALHAVAALVQARATGVGAYVDVAASDATVLSAWPQVTFELNDHRVTDRTGSVAREDGEMSGARYQFYATRDGRVVLFAAIEPRFWATFCQVVERPDLVGDLTQVVDWGDEALRRALTEVFLTRDHDDWVALAVEHGLPIGPANRDLEEVRADRHVAARELFLTETHPVAGEFDYLGSAAVVAGQPYAVHRPAPAFGQHTREVLGELGLDVDALLASGAAVQAEA